MVNESEYKNQWALILGGSAGLGLASAKKLARHGCNIIIVFRSARVNLPEVEKEFDLIRQTGIRFLSFNKDAMNSEKRNEMIEAIGVELGDAGKIRLLLHSIAKGNLKPMLEPGEPELQNEDFHLTLDAMAICLYDWTKLLYQQGLFAPDARVLSFTSEGNQKAVKGYAAVSAAKAALEAITRNIALEFAHAGIRANCIQAGVTDTESFRMIPGHEQIRAHALEHNPVGRLTTPEDIANVVYLLCKDEAAWINGSVIIADGGEHIN